MGWWVGPRGPPPQGGTPDPFGSGRRPGEKTCGPFSGWNFFGPLFFGSPGIPPPRGGGVPSTLSGWVPAGTPPPGFKKKDRCGSVPRASCHGQAPAKMPGNATFWGVWRWGSDVRRCRLGVTGVDLSSSACCYSGMMLDSQFRGPWLEPLNCWFTMLSKSQARAKGQNWRRESGKGKQTIGRKEEGRKAEIGEEERGGEGTEDRETLSHH